MKSYMTTPITSVEEAKKFICELYFDGNMYHFDSPAIDIVDIDDNQAFTDEQAEALEERVNEVFKYIEDPFQLCLALVENNLEENTNLKEELTFQVLSYMKNIINEEEFAQAVVEIYNHYCNNKDQIRPKQDNNHVTN